MGASNTSSAIVATAVRGLEGIFMTIDSHTHFTLLPPMASL